jgi:hypothetical protein
VGREDLGGMEEEGYWRCRVCCAHEPHLLKQPATPERPPESVLIYIYIYII